MRLTFGLTQSPAQISKMILDAMTDELNHAVLKAGPHIQLKIRDRVMKAIQSSPAYGALTSGVLRLDFGLARPLEVLEGISNIWKQELNVTFSRFRPRGNAIVGSFAVDAIDATFKGVLSSKYSSYFSNSEVVDWLNWLLTKGTASVVNGYEVSYRANKMSRTGAALMRPSLSKSFSVDANYSGTVRDNFVTEAIDKAQDDFLQIIEEEIVRVL